MAVRRKQLPAEAGALQGKIQAWRETKKNGSPMPEELWMEAASLARKHGINPVARRLTVGHGALKGWVERTDAVAGGPPREAADGRRALPADEREADDTAASTGFVEVDTRQLVRAFETPGPVVELARPDGARMVIRLPGHESLDVASLATAFCGGGA